MILSVALRAIDESLPLDLKHRMIKDFRIHNPLRRLEALTKKDQTLAAAAANVAEQLVSPGDVHHFFRQIEIDTGQPIVNVPPLGAGMKLGQLMRLQLKDIRILLKVGE